MTTLLQLPLDLSVPEHYSFENFRVGHNAAALSALHSFLSRVDDFYSLALVGPPGAGKTHLLYATLNALSVSFRATYLALHADMQAEALQGFDAYTVIMLDDIEAIEGNPVLAEALFHLFNRVHAQKGRLLFAQSKPPLSLDVLPDLRSRLCSSELYHLHPLNDEDRLKLIQDKAAGMGLVLGDTVGRFLMRRVGRDIPSLLALLHQLDRASLSSQQALTVPFVKRILDL